MTGLNLNSVDEPRTGPDLAAIAAQDIAALLDAVEIGSPLPLDSASKVCAVLERLIPRVLAGKHSEWHRESLDGFYFSHAVRNGTRSAELAGTCILISDQTMTPFRLNIELSAEMTISRLRIRLGEAGGGLLGISGPAWGSSTAWKLLHFLDERLDLVEWRYDEAE